MESRLNVFRSFLQKGKIARLEELKVREVAALDRERRKPLEKIFGWEGVEARLLLHWRLGAFSGPTISFSRRLPSRNSASKEPGPWPALNTSSIAALSTERWRRRPTQSWWA